MLLFGSMVRTPFGATLVNVEEDVLLNPLNDPCL